MAPCRCHLLFWDSTLFWYTFQSGSVWPSRRESLESFVPHLQSQKDNPCGTQGPGSILSWDKHPPTSLGIYLCDSAELLALRWGCGSVGRDLLTFVKPQVQFQHHIKPSSVAGTFNPKHSVGGSEKFKVSLFYTEILRPAWAI